MSPSSIYDNRKHVDNITDWALEQFRKHYQPDRGKKERLNHQRKRSFTTFTPFCTTHLSREVRANLKREFPRIPFYKDFWQWADWGKELMDLHIGTSQSRLQSSSA